LKHTQEKHNSQFVFSQGKSTIPCGLHFVVATRGRRPAVVEGGQPFDFFFSY
jgi:hypothetical protein